MSNRTLTDIEIKRLEELGFKRWKKHDKDRLYISSYNLGLKTERYKTGNISYASFKGEKISNSDGRRYIIAKTYIDVQTGRVYSTYDTLKDAAIELMEKVIPTI